MSSSSATNPRATTTTSATLAPPSSSTHPTIRKSLSTNKQEFFHTPSATPSASSVSLLSGGASLTTIDSSTSSLSSTTNTSTTTASSELDPNALLSIPIPRSRPLSDSITLATTTSSSSSSSITKAPSSPDKRDIIRPPTPKLSVRTKDFANYTPEGAKRSPNKSPVRTTTTTNNHHENVGSEFRGGPKPGKKWIDHGKNFLVLSCAGKPIYARYGDEAQLASFMGVIQAIISFFASEQDQIKSIKAGSHQFVFLIKGPLYYLVVSKRDEPESLLRNQLTYLHNQILSTITHSQLLNIFRTRPNYDLRTLLTGTESFLDMMPKSFARQPAFTLGPVVECLRIPEAIRSKVLETMENAEAPQNLLYSLLVARSKLIHMHRPTKTAHHLYAQDLHLIFNMLHTHSMGQDFRKGDHWLPICLPSLDPNAFVYVYVSYLSSKIDTDAGALEFDAAGKDENAYRHGHWRTTSGPTFPTGQTDEICLIAISRNQDDFFNIRDYKSRIETSLVHSPCFLALEGALKLDPYCLAEVAVPLIRHFVVLSGSMISVPGWDGGPYEGDKRAQKRILRAYARCKEMLVAVEGRMVMMRTGYETIVGIKGYHLDKDTEKEKKEKAKKKGAARGVEKVDLMITMHPFVSVQQVSSVVEELSTWIGKGRNELFLAGY